MENVENYRQQYWEKLENSNYSGIRHVLIVNSIAWPVLFASLLYLGTPTLLSLYSFLLTVLFGSFTVYFVHRWLLHKRRSWAAIGYERHTVQHHSYFTYDSYNAKTSKEWRIVLFPWPLIIGIIIGFSLPVSYGLEQTWGVKVSASFFATTILYYLSYEWLHLYFHTTPHFLDRLSPFHFLKKHHAIHHDPKIMNTKNFNLVLPIFDVIFGTLETLKRYSERRGGIE